MAEDHTCTCHIIIMGEERAVEVDFTIHSFGTADGWLEPGDPPEVEVDKVMSGDRDITQFCSEVRDLYGDGKGFELYHGGLLDGSYGPWCTTQYNSNRTLMEAIEEQIIENLHQYETDPFWYDYGE